MIDRGQVFEIRQDPPSDSALTVRLYGEFDLAGCDEFEEALGRLDLTAVRELVIDLGGVTFIDSSAIRALLSTRAHADRNGLALSVALPRTDGQVRKVLALTGLDGVFSHGSDGA